jgi:hypothetical protein
VYIRIRPREDQKQWGLDEKEVRIDVREEENKRCVLFFRNKFFNL